MGKEGELWDDSALISAFDDALSTYKKMHGSAKSKVNSSQDTENVSAENGSNVEFGTPHTARDVGDKGNSSAVDAPNSDETNNVSKLEENHGAESQVDQPCAVIQDVHIGYARLQSGEDYNQLVAQYYELEEKRLKILEQLNQYGGVDYQYAAVASSSAGPYYNSQVYDPNATCSCCPCFSQYMLAPCTSVPGCSMGGSCVDKPCSSQPLEMDHTISFPRGDGEIHKMAMGAAKRALSTVRTTMSADFNVNEEKERNNTEPEQSNGSETDLTAVLNAWYSAGFYTGKYLVEQSVQNRRQK